METKALYKLKDIQEIFSCSRGKAYDIIHINGFPKIQIGKEFYVVPDDLEKWLKNHKGKTVTC